MVNSHQNQWTWQTTYIHVLCRTHCNGEHQALILNQFAICNWIYTCIHVGLFLLQQLVYRDAGVRFGPVQRPFFPNPKPLLGFGPVWVYSHSEPEPDPEPHFSAIIGNFTYIIKLNLHDHPPVHRKKHCQHFCGKAIKHSILSFLQSYRRLSKLKLQ